MRAYIFLPASIFITNEQNFIFIISKELKKYSIFSVIIAIFSPIFSDLRMNYIAVIRPGIFHGLSELDRLLLNGNRIKYLWPKTFEGVPNLKVLNIGSNRLVSITPGAFVGLPKLRELYLEYNHLREIKKDTFSNLPALERLFLHNNMLHHLPADAFHNVGPMTRLRLDSNALVCDCNLVWLVQRLQNQPLQREALCESPVQMQGRSLMAMSPNDFHCS